MQASWNQLPMPRLVHRVYKTSFGHGGWGVEDLNFWLQSHRSGEDQNFVMDNHLSKFENRGSRIPMSVFMGTHFNSSHTEIWDHFSAERHTPISHCYLMMNWYITGPEKDIEQCEIAQACLLCLLIPKHLQAVCLW